MTTYEDVLSMHNIQIPPHLEAQAEIPVVPAGRLWRQGDLYMRVEEVVPRGVGVPASGVKVVTGEADRNSHILDCEGGLWHAGAHRDREMDYGVCVIPGGRVAYISHTAEHGSVGMAAPADRPGVLRIWGQASYEVELRRAAD